MLVHPLPTRRIVLVEDDEVLQKQLVNLLRRSFSDFDVRDAKDVDDALHLLEDECSRLLITDAQNRSVDGIAVATSARKLRPTLPVIVMTNSGSAPNTGNPPLAASWLKRPPKADRFLGLVKDMLAEPVGFTGSISIQGLADLVQLLCMANISGALHIEHGSERGVIWFENGSLVDASLDGKHGAEVVQRMLRWEGGLFALEREARSERKSIRVPAMQLLLEAAHDIDHERAPVAADGARRAEPPAPPPRSSTSQTRIVAPAAPRKAANIVSPVVPEESEIDRVSPTQRAAEAFQRGMEFALHKQYDAALREWERATTLDPANRIYQVNLRRLRDVRQRSTPTGEMNGDEE
ncbi:MAG: DUF4388 domain-containing protein [Polyangiales bacterium]